MNAPTSRRARRLPDWLKVRAPGGADYSATRAVVRDLRLHTVCEEAHCPNLGECWGQGSATFLLLGEVCTRNCAYCAVSHGRPEVVDPGEPDRVGKAVARLRLRHAVITSVDRDDLPDGGAEHFARTARAVKAERPSCTVEVLTPDFQGRKEALFAVVDAPIEIFNHNTETVPRLYRRARPGGKYERALRLLKWAKGRRPDVRTKSGLMLGLGERRDELRRVFLDLADAGCDILTLGQYLQPSRDHLAVDRFLSPREFADIAAEARDCGFRHVEAGPLVRSSYHAAEQAVL